MGNEESISYFLVFFAALLAVVVIFQKWLHDRPTISSFLPEAAMVLGMGMIFGFFIHLTMGKRVAAQVQDDDGASQEVDLKALLSFSPSVFFVALLPPILFNSGLRIGPLFFRHLVPICLFSVVGTAISALSTAFILKGVIDLGLCGNFEPSLIELLCFGSLISSTDPISTLAVFQAKKVDPQLFYLVFGESALNDALAIVLFDSFARFVAKDNDAEAIALGFAEFLVDLFLNSFGSLLLGGLCGLGTAYIFKQLDMRQNRLMEISLYLLLVYIPFLLAEVLNLSGIVTILFTGVAANRYVVPNLSSITKVNADMLFRLLAHLAETSIFLELGLSVFGLIGHWNWKFIGWALLATLIGRGLNIIPLSFLFNQCLLRGAADPCASDKLVEDDNILQYRRAFSPVGTSHQGLGNFGSPLVASSHSGVEHPPVAYASSFGEISVETATPFTRKDLKIRSNTCAMVWYSGLRGAVSYACSRSFPDESKYKLDFIMTTMALVVITVFVLGGTTELVLSFLGIDVGVDEDTYMRESLKEPLVSNKITNFEKRYIFPRVVRDYHCMHGIQSDPRKGYHYSQWQRPRTPVDPTIEITESGYLETTNNRREDVGIATDERADIPIGLLVRQDTLFDYGAQ
jgi:NhaP-type Na+/H+ or K+/H+ antiporter